MDIQEELSNLNEMQRLAVTEKDAKKLLVLAGAGSGKTRVLTVRIAYLLSFGISPENVFAVTFTNKAANEMKERIVSLSNQNISTMWVGTFHSLALRLIKDNIQKVDVSNGFTIWDDQDQKQFIRNILTDIEENEPEKLTYVYDSIKEEIKSIQGFINTCKDNEMRPHDCDSLIEMNKEIPEEYKLIYERYEKKRILSNSVDFSDLILYAVEILRDNPSIQKYYGDKFKYVFVDEFQDTNPIQYRLISLLSNKNTYQTMVGDDDQLIYSWRGANVDNMVQYKKSSKEVKIVKLEQNYRSTNNILMAANSVIAKNKVRIGKKLWSEKEAGEKIHILENNNQFSEGNSVVGEISKLIKKGVNPNKICILYRNNYLSNSFENVLTKYRIPYKIVGGLSFWQRKEIKDILSYLLLIHENKNDLAFERAIAAPKIGLGKKNMQKIKLYAYSKNISYLYATKELISNNEIKGKLGDALNNFVTKIEYYTNSNQYIHELINGMLEDFNIMDTYRGDDKDKFEERKSNIGELQNYARFYNDKNETGSVLSEFLQNSILQSDNDKDKNKDSVTLMTIHASKGLEYEYVFVVGFEEGIFPSNRAILIESKDESKMEEERRLGYVSITRAQIGLYISYTNSRYNQYAEPSRFLGDVPAEILNLKSDSPFGLSWLGQKIRDLKKDGKKKNDTPYVVGESFNDELMGDGEIVSAKKENNYYVLEIDFGFLGVQKKYINN